MGVDSKKTKSLELAITQIDRQFGKGSIMKLGDDHQPSFENSNRCLIPADGWYEWKSEEDEKIPYFHHADGDIFFFAGVYGGYRGKLGCAIVTMEALETTKEIHERMPLIVARSHFKEWLEGSDSNSFDEAMVKSIKHHRVSTHVNNPTNNDPKCIFPTS